MYYIYKIQFQQYIYIGLTNNFPHRVSQHRFLYNSNHSNKFYDTLHELGNFEDFDIAIIAEFDIPFLEARKKEKEFYLLHKDRGYTILNINEPFYNYKNGFIYEDGMTMPVKCPVCFNDISYRNLSRHLKNVHKQ